MANKPTYEELEKRVQELEEIESEHKLEEEKLYEKMIFSQTLLQAAPVFFVAINAEGKTIIANETMLNSLGYKQEEIVGKEYLTTFVPKKNREELSKIFYKLIRLNKPTSNENYILTKDGKEILIEWHGRSIFDKKEEFLYFIGLGIDVTLRKKSEEMVRDKDRLQGALELSGAVCHEMTQPLMSVLGYFDLMLIDMPVDDLNYSKIGKIKTQLERMSNITKKMMEISRYQTKDYLNRKIIDLAGIPISEKLK